MRTLVAYPGNGDFAQQVALAFLERQALAAFMTTFHFRENGAIGRLLDVLPTAIISRLKLELSRRSIRYLPEAVIEERPGWEVARSLASKVGFDRRIVDGIWDMMSHDFTRAVGRRLGKGRIGAVYAYEYSALEAFQEAKRRGVATILDLPSLHSRAFEELQRREKARFPELIETDELYFRRKFERRQSRRDAEAAIADVIITNSSVTKASHVRFGVDSEKIFVVSLGSPPAASIITQPNLQTPLSVIWAGKFGIGKAGHLFVEAWKSFYKGGGAHADIYGAVALPDRFWNPAPAGMVFHGSVPRPVLFEAFSRADVLIFPTLSDGFGMVVTEAFAQGVPVITTDQAGASDLVRHGVNGLIIPTGDVEAIKNALMWCLDNREQLAEMRHGALETAKAWQWSNYRCALIAAVSQGLQRAGFEPAFASLHKS
jgi:glycosyltransferase involved in cell wall biosynthesis